MGQSCLASTGQPICHWAAAEWLHGGSLPPVASQVAREAAGHCAGRTGLLTALSSHQEMEPESAQLLHKRDIPDLGTPRGTWPPQKVGDREYCFHFAPSDHQAHTELLKYELFTPQSSASCSCLCGANSFLCLLPSLPAHLMKLTQPKGHRDTLGSTEVGLASLHTLPPLPSPGSCSLAEGIQSLGVCSCSQEPNRPHCTFSAAKLRSCFMLSSVCKEPCQRPADRGHLSIDLPRPTSPHAGLQLEARRPSSDSGVVRSSFET